LEPYGEDYECLNCGSIASKAGLGKTAARPKGGLGRRLQDIQPYEGDPLNLGTGGSENPENVVDLDETQGHHPLFGQENQNPDEVYQAPKRILGAAADLIDEHMGKHGYQPIHRAGEPRIYLAEMPGTRGAYARLTEHNDGWKLTADTVNPRDRRSLMMDTNRGDQKRIPMANPGEHSMGDKTLLAEGHHPIEDDQLNRASQDVAQNGRESHVYKKVFDTAFETTRPARPGAGMSQQDLRHLSSGGNPGIARFIS